MTAIVRLTFVCMGNICRSPTAHGVMRHKVRAAGWADRVHVDSAGTHGWHEGAPPDERSIAHARKRGYDIGDLRSRPLVEADFVRSDLLLVMDERNLADAREIGAAEHHAKLRLLTDFGRRHRAAAVSHSTAPSRHATARPSPDQSYTVTNRVVAACRRRTRHGTR